MKMRLPQTMGVETPRPRSLTRQATFSVSLHVEGRFDSEDTPVSPGPRHAGQFSAESTAVVARASVTAASVRVILG